MPKGEARRVNQESQDIHHQNQDLYNRYMPYYQNQADIYSQRGQGEYGQLYQNYGDLARRGREGAFSDPTARAGYSYLANTGGWSPSDRAGTEEDIGTLRGYAGDLTNWARNPISEADKQRWRGGGVYDEFAKTGGISMADRARMRNVGGSQVGSMLSGLRDDLARQSAVTGRPISAAALNQSARQGAIQTGNNAAETELGITNQVNQGRQWGAQGMTSSESSLQDFLKQAMLGGYGLASEDIKGAGGLRQAMLDSINRTKYSGLQGLSDEAARNLQAEGMGLAGQMGLHGETTAQQNQMLNYLMTTMGMSQQEASNYIQQQMGYNPNRGFMDYLAPFLGAGAGVAGGFFNRPQSNNPYANQGAGMS